MRVCELCGIDIRHKRKDARFCSEEHRKRAEAARYRVRYPERVRATNKAYRARPEVKARRAEQSRDWKEANREKVRDSNRKQYVRELRDEAIASGRDGIVYSGRYIRIEEVERRYFDAAQG